MTKTKKILILASFLIIFGILGCIFTYNNYSKNFSSNSFNGLNINIGNNSPIETFSEEKLIEQDFNSIVLDSDNSYVYVIPTDSNSSKITVTGIPKSLAYDFSADVKDDILNINFKDKNTNSFNFSFNSENLKIKIYIPQKLYESIQITTDNGIIESENIIASKIIIKTSNGIINLKNIVSDNLNLKSFNGIINFSGEVNKELIGETSNGKIDFNLKTMDIPINLESSNGSITIKSSKEPNNVTFDVNVNNGTTNIFSKYEDNDVIGQGENLIKLKTSNGKITIKN